MLELWHWEHGLLHVLDIREKIKIESLSPGENKGAFLFLTTFCIICHESKPFAPLEMIKQVIRAKIGIPATQQMSEVVPFASEGWIEDFPDNNICLKGLTNRNWWHSVTNGSLDVPKIQFSEDKKGVQLQLGLSELKTLSFQFPCFSNAGEMAESESDYFFAKSGILMYTTLKEHWEDQCVKAKLHFYKF